MTRDPRENNPYYQPQIRNDDLTDEELALECGYSLDEPGWPEYRDQIRRVSRSSKADWLMAQFENDLDEWHFKTTGKIPAGSEMLFKAPPTLEEISENLRAGMDYVEQEKLDQWVDEFCNDPKSNARVDRQCEVQVGVVACTVCGKPRPRKSNGDLDTHQSCEEGWLGFHIKGPTDDPEMPDYGGPICRDCQHSSEFVWDDRHGTVRRI